MESETHIDPDVMHEHIYGHSSIWDMLIYELGDEKRCLDNGQLDDCTYPYTMFNYCPECGIKIDR